MTYLQFLITRSIKKQRKARVVCILLGIHAGTSFGYWCTFFQLYLPD